MNSLRIAIAAAAAAATVVGIATPAFAAAPGWEPGYSPTCSVGEGAWVDSAAPIIVDRNAKSYLTQGITKPTAPRSLGTITVRDRCSGVKDVRLTYTVPAGFGYGPFSTTHTTTVTGKWHNTTIAMMAGIPWNAYGKLIITKTRVRDRMNWFDLDATNSVVTSYELGSRIKYNTVQRTIYLLRSTQLTAGISDSTVTSGDAVVISARMRNADCDADCGMLPTPSSTVELQWRQNGSSTWSTISSGATNASGRRNFTRHPSASGSYRLRFAGKFASPWLAPSYSYVVTIAVT
ncbi:MAG: hypothetical protein WCP26_15420 [Actinomycetes bacterium]